MSSKKGTGGHHPHQQQTNPSASPPIENSSRSGAPRRPKNVNTQQQEDRSAPAQQHLGEQQGHQLHHNMTHANNTAPQPQPLLSLNNDRLRNNTFPPPPPIPMNIHHHHPNRPAAAEDEDGDVDVDRNLLFAQRSPQIEDINGVHSTVSNADLDDEVDVVPSEDESTALINELPENVIETLFTYLGYSDIKSCITVCSYWFRLLASENSEVWRRLTRRKMGREIIRSGLLSVCKTYKAKLRAYFYAWNPRDCSRNMYIKSNLFTLHRNPVAQSTDGVRSKRGFNRGRHAWEIIWQGPLGTVAVVGIATRRAEIRSAGYIALLGQDDQSWGWNLVENVLLHNGDPLCQYPFIDNPPHYQTGEKLHVILDCDDGTLSFEKNHETTVEFLGIAFHGLPRKEYLYPAISAVYGNTEVSMVYLGSPVELDDD